MGSLEKVCVILTTNKQGHEEFFKNFKIQTDDLRTDHGHVHLIHKALAFMIFLFIAPFVDVQNVSSLLYVLANDLDAEHVELCT